MILIKLCLRKLKKYVFALKMRITSTLVSSSTLIYINKSSTKQNFKIVSKSLSELAFWKDEANSGQTEHKTTHCCCFTDRPVSLCCTSNPVASIRGSLKAAGRRLSQTSATPKRSTLVSSCPPTVSRKRQTLEVMFAFFSLFAMFWIACSCSLRISLYLSAKYATSEWPSEQDNGR